MLQAHTYTAVEKLFMVLGRGKLVVKYRVYTICGVRGMQAGTGEHRHVHVRSGMRLIHIYVIVVYRGVSEGAQDSRRRLMCALTGIHHTAWCYIKKVKRGIKDVTTFSTVGKARTVGVKTKR